MTAAHASRPLPTVSSGDRLGLTIFLAVVLHSLVILGISFDIDRRQPKQKLPGLEVTLVQSKTDAEVKNADFLAQASQLGGGDSEQKERPSTPIVPVVPTGEAGEIREVVPETHKPTSPEPPREEILTTAESERKISAGIAMPEAEPEPQLSAAELLSRSKQIAALTAEIDQTQRVFAHRPKRKYISAQTREYQYASYEEAWRAKVERIGRINFPDEAKRQMLSGSLIMAVTISADGTIKDVEIRQSSKHKILDDAAVRIVRLAAPFARFTQEMRDEVDELVITRTWIFEAGARFTAQ